MHSMSAKRRREAYIPLPPSDGTDHDDQDGQDDHGYYDEEPELFTDLVVNRPDPSITPCVKIFLLIIAIVAIVVSIPAVASIDLRILPALSESNTKPANSTWSIYPANDSVEHDDIPDEDEVINTSLGATDGESSIARPDVLITNDSKVVEPEEQARAKAELVDKKYCGKSPCNFVFMSYVHEQETKAQWHVRNWAFLSGLLNRTFVLPQVFRSRMGACSKFSFFNYYSPSYLDSNADSFSYITHTDFLSWSREYPFPLTAQTVYLHRTNVEDKPVNYKPPSLDRLSGIVCAKDLWKLDFVYNAYENPLVIFKVNNYWKDARKKMLDHVLGTLNDPALAFGRTNETKDAMAKVLVVETHLVWEPFVLNHAAMIPFEYNAHWQHVAEDVASQLSPYVAIHWRMETIPAKNMPQCARDLANTIRLLDNVSNIYLATDYPLQNEGGAANSGTFYDLQPEHREAIDVLKEAFPNITWSYLVNNDPLSQELAGNKTVSAAMVRSNQLTRRAPERRGIPIVVDSDFDSGYLAIVDKLVAVNADYFVAAPRGTCGRALSSFTAQIIRMREAKSQKGHEGRARRVVRRARGSWEQVERWEEAENWLVFS
ncbi:hypothetical protein BC937DRAFT_91719 [Endogone sp. FLAS-F59071]|nr:hypothetical protein BC937DRAFT_91719 [Endogone sp. FLAS-F59071]|eukprot:RUS15995.1 hypothetical protein BC937DRAFT_91719 [Endogone sp. FLAS-F59071]